MPRKKPVKSPSSPRPHHLEPVHDPIRGLVPRYTDDVYEDFLSEHKIREDRSVHAALAISPDPRFVRFLNRLGDPKERTKRLQVLALSCGIKHAEFVEWFSKSSVQRAIARAQQNAPRIIDDMSLDALSKQESCARCDGLGWVGAEEGQEEAQGFRIQRFREAQDSEGLPVEIPVYVRTCPACSGARSLRAPGDEFSREHVLEVGKFINQRGPGMVLMQNFGGQSHASAVTRLPALTLEAEVVEPAEG